MKNFYFTFGNVHTTASGESLGSNYCVIKAKDQNAAREKMIKARGNKWAFCYTSKLLAGVSEYGLIPVKLHLIRLWPEKGHLTK